MNSTIITLCVCVFALSGCASTKCNNWYLSSKDYMSKVFEISVCKKLVVEKKGEKTEYSYRKVNELLGQQFGTENRCQVLPQSLIKNFRGQRVYFKVECENYLKGKKVTGSSVYVIKMESILKAESQKRTQ